MKAGFLWSFSWLPESTIRQIENLGAAIKANSDSDEEDGIELGNSMEPMLLG